MLAQYYKYRDENTYLQLSMRPIQLWEMAFPKEALGNVMNTLWDNPAHQKTGKVEVRNHFKPFLYAMRKSLNAKKIPPLDLKAGKRIVDQTEIGIYPIGIREDKIDDEGNEDI